MYETEDDMTIVVNWTLPDDALACQIVFELPDLNDNLVIKDQSLAECECDASLTNG